MIGEGGSKAAAPALPRSSRHHRSRHCRWHHQGQAQPVPKSDTWTSSNTCRWQQQRQQPHRPRVSPIAHHQRLDLRRWPLSTFLPL